MPPALRQSYKADRRSQKQKSRLRGGILRYPGTALRVSFQAMPAKWPHSTARMKARCHPTEPGPLADSLLRGSAGQKTAVQTILAASRNLPSFNDRRMTERTKSIGTLSQESPGGRIRHRICQGHTLLTSTVVPEVESRKS